ncbi:alpha/beta hydrolase [Streptomyces sp. NPDC005820]|uniref:alpha/beta hydrolase n=1 Tax=Streptomyces sp. NPDC005820 TaxID=3157069 RepID=UPI0033FE7577
MSFRSTAAPALAAALALSLLTATDVTATAPSTASGATVLAAFHHQRLTWKSCVLGPQDTLGGELAQADAQCADVRVPLDYARPDGRTITVAITRIRATDTAHRVGSLLLNSGGPAGETLGDAPWIRRTMKDVGARYDIIGVDPRFVGRSTPLDCHWPTGSFFRSAGADRAGFDRMTAFARDLADRCRRHAADVLPYVTTRDTARDMDVIRAAVGERRISFLGYSYGSYLAQVYVTMFPGRTDRMVVDGVMDASRYSPRLLRGSETANRRALEHWASWAAARDATYGLGSTRRAVLAVVDHIQATAARRPLELGEFRMDEHLVAPLIMGGLSQDNDTAFGNLAQAVRGMRRAAEGGQVTPSPVLTEMLTLLLTGASSPYGSAQTAILCGDVPDSRDPEVYWHDVQRSRALDPLFGPATHNITPCAFWAPPRERPTTVTDDFPALLVNATGDPRDPYDGALLLHRKWRSSRLVTLRGADQHGVYGYGISLCADEAVNAYLATGRLPRQDVSCGRL